MKTTSQWRNKYKSTRNKYKEIIDGAPQGEGGYVIEHILIPNPTSRAEAIGRLDEAYQWCRDHGISAARQ